MTILSSTVARSAARHVSLSATSVGVSLFPVLALAVFGRVVSAQTLGQLSIALGFGTFLGQILTAFVVEAPLASPGADGRDIRNPWFFSAFGVAAAIALAVAPIPLVIVICMPVLLAVLQVGRSVGVVELRQGRELFAAIALLVTALISLVTIGTYERLGVLVLMAGVVIAIAFRFDRGGDRFQWPQRRAAFWVVLDALTTGATQPYLNLLLYFALGPAAAVAFRAASSVSAAVEPMISVSRLRLLRKHSAAEFVTSIVIVVGAVCVALAFDVSGLFNLLMGKAWIDVTFVVFALALVGRSVTLLATPYFAQLRRENRVAIAYWLRLISTGVYLVLGSLGALKLGAAGAFIGMGLAEMLTFGMFVVAAKRGGADARNDNEPTKAV